MSLRPVDLTRYGPVALTFSGPVPVPAGALHLYCMDTAKA